MRIMHFLFWAIVVRVLYYSMLCAEFIWMTIKVNFSIFLSVLHWLIPVYKRNISRRAVVITGGGNGIGRAMAVEFAKEGATIVLLDIDREGLKESERAVVRAGVACYTHVCDVTKKCEVDEVAKTVLENVRHMEILVNNAGVFACRQLEHLSEAEIRRTFEVNSISMFWTVKAFLPCMVRKKRGQIVTISSMAAKHGSPLTTDYTASKFAAYGFTEALRNELRMLKRDYITCSVVCPMMVNTGMLRSFAHRIKFRDRFGRIYDAKYVAKETVTRVLRGQLYIHVPSSSKFINILNLLPYPSRMAVSDFVDAGFTEVRR